MSSRRGVLVVVLLIVFGTMASMALWLFVSLFATPPPPSVPANATLYLPIEAPFSELERNDVISQFVRVPPTLRQTLEAIRKAKLDTRVKTLVIMPRRRRRAVGTAAGSA